MTNEQVTADIAANLPDNSSGLITPAKLRTEMGKMVDYSDTAAAAATAAHNADAGAHSLLVSMAPRLRKINPMATLFAASGQTVVTAQECYARVGGVIIRIPGSTAVALPTLTAGTDYAIYLLANGTLLASANFSAPDGYTTATSTQLGGAHYAPGGVATGFSRSVATGRVVSATELDHLQGGVASRRAEIGGGYEGVVRRPIHGAILPGGENLVILRGRPGG